MKTQLNLLANLVILPSFAQGASLVGLWNFDNPANLGEATVGTDLAFEGTLPIHTGSMGDDGGNSQSGVITTIAGPDNRISSTHGIAPNGGGDFVNQYSLVADVFSPVSSRGSWRTIYQTNTNNSNDGEFFIRNSDNGLGVADLGYSGSMDDSAWTRIVITLDLTEAGSDVSTYLDGSLFFTHPGDPVVDGRFSLDPSVYFFTDNDGDNAPLNIGALALYDGVLTPIEVNSLGAAGAAIIPEPSSLALLTLCGLGFIIRRRR